MLVGDVDGEVDWDLADLMGDPEISSRASILGIYCHLLARFFVVC